MKKISFLAVLTVLLFSCGESSSNEADRLRRELETQENATETDRNIRDRNNELKLNEINNEDASK